MEKRAPLAYRLPALLFPLLFLFPALPPFVDYPQHVAIGAVLARLRDASSFASHKYVANLLTYNGLFDELVALLSLVVPAESGARIVVVVALELFVLGAFALFSRQRTHAAAHLLLVALLPSFALFWGFTNHLLGLGLGVVLVAVLVRVVAQRERRLGPNLGVALLGLTLAHTHVLATLITLVIAGAWVLDEALRDEPSWRARAPRLGHAALLVAPACVFCIAVHLRQFASHAHTYSVVNESETDPLLLKLAWFGVRVTGALRSHHDAHLVWAALVVAVALGITLHRTSTREHRPVILPVVALGLAYALVPAVFIGTYLVYPRLALPLAMLGLSLVPASREPAPRTEVALRGAAALVAACTFLVTGSALAHFDTQARDLAATLRELPPTAHVTAVHAATTTNDYELPVLQHVAAYHVGAHDAHAAGIFGGYASLPVRFREAELSPTVTWLEGEGDKFSPDDPYAKLFPVRIVVLEFADDALPPWALVHHRLLARHGAFAAVEATTP